MVTGQEQFRSFTSSYFRDKDGYVVVFSVTDAQSLQNVAHWVKEIRGWDESYQVVVVANKIDVEDKERAVTTKEAEEFLPRWEAANSRMWSAAPSWTLTAPKAFDQIARQCLGTEKMTAPLGSTPSTPLTSPLNLREQPEQKNFTCCN